MILSTVVGGEPFFWVTDFSFAPITFDWDIVWLWFFILRVALCLKIIFHTYLMVLRRLENFLRALEVDVLQIFGTQKELKMR